MYFNEALLVSKQLNTKSALKYIIVISGIPVNVQFNSKDFSDLLSWHKRGNIS